MSALSPEDFHQRYTGTYVRYNDEKNKRKLVVYIEGTHVADRMVSLTNPETGDMTLNYPNCLKSLDLTIPETGYFNHAGNAMYMFRKPERQWKRGTCAGTCEFYNPLKRFLNSGVYRPNFGWTVVRRLFDPEFAPGGHIDKTIQQLINDNNMVSVALNNHIMLSKSPIEKSPVMLWYGVYPVGLLTDKQKSFNVVDLTFEQEIHDEFRNLGLYKWIS